jgi:murein DD-endopeptidase MepM/ murein hydrolase activator NlpD
VCSIGSGALFVENALRAATFAGLALAVGVIASAHAQEMRAPRISHAEVDWDAVDADLRPLAPLLSLFAPAPDGTATGPAEAPPLATLNRLTGERFAKIANSPVPVLLPFDTQSLLRDRAYEVAPASAPNAYLSGFEAAPFFQTGPGGYDVVVSALAQDMKELGIAYAQRIFIQLSGASVVYDLPSPTGMITWPVNGGIDAEFPGIKRVFLENYARYAFVRYGVPYVVSIECFDGAARFGKIACKDADAVAIHFLKSLRLAGGQPPAAAAALAPTSIDRPEAQSAVFTYFPPGGLVPNSGTKGKLGAGDYTVFSRIRFPLADAPAYANSQIFRAESAPQNYAYPWRDNFCEHRAFYVGQCPAGLGHQGQDIRPAFCRQRGPGARCEPYEHEVVAVRDGMVMRAPGQMAIYVVVNAPNERIRFRYLHMLPKQLDADAMVSGRPVKEGEAIGKVGNFNYREGATTYHLHFDVQVPTRYGWVFVSPYMTLVAAYERLIQARGRELRDEFPTASINAAAKAALPVIGAPPAVPDAEIPATTAVKPTETTVESPAPTTIKVPNDAATHQALPARVPAAHPGGAPGVEHASNSAGRPGALRPVGRGVPRPSPSPRRIRRDVQEDDDDD